MKLRDFRPGQRVCAGNTKNKICDGILSKEIKFGRYENHLFKTCWYIRGCIIKRNGKKSWWPIYWIKYIKNIEK